MYVIKFTIYDALYAHRKKIAKIYARSMNYTVSDNFCLCVSCLELQAPAAERLLSKLVI